MLLFLIIGLTLAVFMMLLLWLRKDKARADYILISWLALISFQILLFYSFFNGLIYQYPKIIVGLSAIPLLHGVLVYFYTREMIGTLKLTTKTVALHLTPLILLSLLTIPFYLIPEERQLRLVNGDFEGFRWYMYIKLVMIVVSGLAYSAASIFEVRRYRKRIKNYLSNTDHLQLRWLEVLSAGIGAIWIVALFMDDFYISIGVILFVITIALFSMNQLPVLYSNQLLSTPDKTSNSESEPSSEKYAKSGLDEGRLQTIIQKVECFMHSEKAFKNPELTLKELSEQTGIPSHQLSQAINSHHGKTFYTYINNLRLEEFLEMAQLPESQKYTYLSLAYDAGFNSKTTFNKYFKLTTGKTPTQYFSSIQTKN